MEYDSIQLVNDFIPEERLEKISGDAKKEDTNMAKLNEEINLLYVAITRTKHKLYIFENSFTPRLSRITEYTRDKKRRWRGRKRRRLSQQNQHCPAVPRRERIQ